jgi:D-alanyl-D-alanine carboxypeptidase
MDGNSLEVIESKNANEVRLVASISKIMTAIIVIEKDILFDVVIVDEVINQIEGSSLYLKIGDQITIIDLLYGLMLRSGNDAGVILASYREDSISSFVEKMNKKALEIGMNNTSFNNPTGLDIFDEGNLSTSYDMCLLMAYALQNDLFREIIKTKYYQSQLKGRWKNKNRLLFEYQYLLGGKTGYTKKAKRTLVTASEKNNQLIIITTLNCTNDFTFHRTKYEEYFNNYLYYHLLNKGINYLNNYIFYSDRKLGIYLKKSTINDLVLFLYYEESNHKLIVYLMSNGIKEQVMIIDEIYLIKGK